MKNTQTAQIVIPTPPCEEGLQIPLQICTGGTINKTIKLPSECAPYSEVQMIGGCRVA